MMPKKMLTCSKSAILAQSVKCANVTAAHTSTKCNRGDERPSKSCTASRTTCTCACGVLAAVLPPANNAEEEEEGEEEEEEEEAVCVACVHRRRRKVTGRDARVCAVTG